MSAARTFNMMAIGTLAVGGGAYIAANHYLEGRNLTESFQHAPNDPFTYAITAGSAIVGSLLGSIFSKLVDCCCKPSRSGYDNV